MANFRVTVDKVAHTLHADLGRSLWNIAINSAPYRTGNLRSAIYMQRNSQDVKRFIYDDYKAYYLNFLEEGKGRNKKHVGFIENKTVNTMVMEIMNYIQTGKATFNSIPKVVLRTDKARNYERKLLNDIGFNLNRRITANDRATLSKNFYRTVEQKRGKGYSQNMKPEILKTFGNDKVMVEKGIMSEVK